MKLPIHVHRVRLGAEEFRVVRPARPIGGAVLSDQSPGFMLELSARAAFDVTALWMLAARSRHTLVHIPLRGNEPPEPDGAESGRGELDLVLSHRHRQFAPHRWKELRARLGPAALQTVAWNPNDVHSWDEVHDGNRQARQQPSAHPGLGQNLQAHTLFLAGDRAAFTRTARYILHLATWRPQPDQVGYHSATLHPADGHFTADSQGVYLIRWR